jgi:hypothetical protein
MALLCGTFKIPYFKTQVNKQANQYLKYASTHPKYSRGGSPKNLHGINKQNQQMH